MVGAIGETQLRTDDEIELDSIDPAQIVDVAVDRILGERREVSGNFDVGEVPGAPVMHVNV
jgi:hypothetical protein